MSLPATIKGDAYTAPSSESVHATDGLPMTGVAGPTPVRPASWWYSSQSDLAKPGNGVVEATTVGVGAVEIWAAWWLLPAHAVSASPRASAPTRLKGPS